MADGMMFKMEDDPRIIGSHFDADGKYVPGIGNLIRKLSLDEFPQFFNVLLGDMSLVGTRPPTVDEYEKYKLHHKARLSAKPGITGMWQVSGRSDITDFEDVVKLDTAYIKDWSIGKDLRISSPSPSAPLATVKFPNPSLLNQSFKVPIQPELGPPSNSASPLISEI